MKTGVTLISEERQKQIHKHGFTAQHHADHPEWYDNNQLQSAAATLLMHELQEGVDVPENLPAGWDLDWFEDLNRRSREERLQIAGALIAAELDRLQVLKKERSEGMPVSQVATGAPVTTSLEGCPFHYCDSDPVCTGKCRYSN